MIYKLTDEQFTDELRAFLNMEDGDPVPVMPLTEDLESIDRAKTLELVPFAEMPKDKKEELLAEAV